MEIEYEDFIKLDIRVGLIKRCEKVPKSRNLYKLMVDCGENSLRQILTDNREMPRNSGRIQGRRRTPRR